MHRMHNVLQGPEATAAAEMMARNAASGASERQSGIGIKAGSGIPCYLTICLGRLMAKNNWAVYKN